MRRPPGSGSSLALAALFAYVAVDLTRVHLYFPWLGRLRPMLVLGAVAVLAAVGSRWRELPSLVRPLAPAAVLCAWAGVSVAWSVDRATTLEKSFEVAKIFVIVAIVVLLVDSLQRLTAALWVAALSLLAVAAQTIVAAYRSGLMSSFSYAQLDLGVRDNNDVARLLAMSIPLWWALWSLGRPAQRVLVGAGFAVITLGVVATYSRGGFLTTVAVLLLLLGVARRGQRLGALLPAALLAIALLVPAPYKERVGSVAGLVRATVETVRETPEPPAPEPQGSARATSSAGADSAASRLAIWRLGARMIRERPVRGGGLATFMAQYAELEPERIPRTSHNIYVELAAELGMVGLLAYGWMCGAALLPLIGLWWRGRIDPPPGSPGSTLAISLVVSLVAFLLSSAMLSAAFRSEALTVVALCLAARRVVERATGPSGV